MKITIFTDGSSRGNPGPGGWSAILIIEEGRNGGANSDSQSYESNDMVMEFGGREDMTTNNRMELMGAIVGLREIDGKKSEHVEVCTDSQYVKKGMTEWISGWIKNGWKSSTKKPVLNKDLWESLKTEEDRLRLLGTKVTWKYVPGHAGVVMNERADVIATTCADNLPITLYRGLKSEYRP